MDTKTQNLILQRENACNLMLGYFASRFPSSILIAGTQRRILYYLE